MPRCMMSVSPLSSPASRYFARRERCSTRRPVRRLTKRSGNGNRKSGRRCSTSSIAAPTRTGARPRRTVSTSGISGIGMALDDGEEGRTVFLQLGDADAVNGGKFFEAARQARRHLVQGAVGENDIGRLTIALCEIGSHPLHPLDDGGPAPACPL